MCLLQHFSFSFGLKCSKITIWYKNELKTNTDILQVKKKKKETKQQIFNKKRKRLKKEHKDQNMNKSYNIISMTLTGIKQHRYKQF